MISIAINGLLLAHVCLVPFKGSNDYHIFIKSRRKAAIDDLDLSLTLCNCKKLIIDDKKSVGHNLLRWVKDLKLFHAIAVVGMAPLAIYNLFFKKTTPSPCSCYIARYNYNIDANKGVHHDTRKPNSKKTKQANV